MSNKPKKITVHRAVFFHEDPEHRFSKGYEPFTVWKEEIVGWFDCFGSYSELQIGQAEGTIRIEVRENAKTLEKMLGLKKHNCGWSPQTRT